jgi:hypothetical protein
MFIVEKIAWSVARKCLVRFRLTYSHIFLPERNLWRDFLVGSEELEVI